MPLQAWGVAAAIAVAMIFFLTPAAFLARYVTQTPFPGFFAEPTLMVNDVGDSTWPGYTAGLHLPDVLVALNGQPLENTTALMQTLEQHESGDVVTLTVQAEDDTEHAVRVRLESFPTKGMLGFFILPYAMGLLYLGIGIWVLVAQWRNSAGRVFALLCATISLSLGLLFDVWTTHQFPRVWIAAVSLISGVLAHLALVFPQRVRFLERIPSLRYLVYAPGVFLAIANQFTILDFDTPTAYLSTWRVTFASMGIGLVAMLAMMVYRYRYSQSPVVQAQARVILWGSLLGFGPIVAWFLITPYTGGVFPPTLILPWLIFFPISIAYAIFRHRLFNINVAISRGVAYALLSVIGVGIYFFLLYLIDHMFGVTLSTGHPIVLGVFVLLMTLILNQAWGHLQHAVDRVFLGKLTNRRELVRRFANQLTEMMELPSVLEALDRTLEAGWSLESAALFLHDPQRACYIPHAMNSESFPPVTFTREGPLAHQMLKRRKSIYLYQDRPLPAYLTPERETLELLCPALFIPVAGHGWLMLGSKRSGEFFSSDDLDILESLGSHMTLALEKVNLVNDLKRRVAEMDVLRWVGQAVNFTMDVDDLMKLIYTQTSRVLDTTNFYIALYNPEKKTLSFAFYVEDNKRLYPDDEWSIEMGLTGEIVRTGKPIVAKHYLQECIRRGITPGGLPGRSWMGVPLIAGAQVIGVMNVSSLDSTVAYSDEQLNIFSAIADQAAAILDRARLYRETEKRAQQLAALNEVGSVITSTLDLQSVLNLIMSKAVELLNAEAGSLVLVDQDTGEMVFRVTAGPGSADLVGVRLPLGTGIIGAVIQEGESIVIRDAHTDPRWYGEVDDSTGFVTNSVLAVPMFSRGSTIGVLQLLNRPDGTPFDQDDERLLAAFAADAAISVENARLFTQTDQALAARVEELTMMQRIDRELNATLDYQQVMEITLDWALRMTGADIGLLAAVVEAEGEQRTLRFLANRGYPEEAFTQEEPWTLDRGIIGRVAQTGRPELVTDVKSDPDYEPTAPGMVAQLTAPIKREEQTIGIIALESSQDAQLDPEAMEFVIRLVDHAAIALENARLFEQVRRANEAKTEFVSFVSHELKQPMTSIKGYTDLLSKGAVGQLNDTQRDFLNTVQSNVDRMNTLVSELLDVSRIESGSMHLEFTNVSIEQVIEEALRTIRGQIEAKQQTLEVEMAPDLPPVWGDRDRLVQVLTNVVSNAYKYTPEGGHIAIRAQLESNERDETERPAFVQCSIADTGIGIAPQDQERLFTKYFRADHPVVHTVPGTGLGLVITKSVVELHGGEIWLESQVGKGSTFTFTIPVAQ